METIRRLLNHFFDFVHLTLINPGPAAFGAVFAVAFADAVVPIPGGMDGIVATAILESQGKWLYAAGFIVLAALGNTAGNIIIYVIGYKGGEVLLEKRIGKEKFASMRAKFEKREVLTLMLAGMMPPPFPFKTLVLAAAAFEVNFRRFLLGIFLGRLVRFSILATLVLLFGLQIMQVARTLFRQHLTAFLLSLAAILAVVLLVKRLKRNKEPGRAKQNADLSSDRSA